MWFYFFLYFILALSGAAYKYRFSSQNRWLLLSLWLLLFVVAAFRGSDVDNDHYNYTQAIINGDMTEPSFLFISYISYKILGSINLVFVIYAFLSTALLFMALRKLSPYFYLSLVIYFASCYVTRDLNQIRAAVAFGFALLALKPWISNKFLKTISLIFIAGLFHFSFFILLPIYFSVKNNKNNIHIYIFAIPVVYILYFMGINVLSLLMRVPIDYVRQMATAYSEWGTDVVKSVNVFSILVLIKLLLASLFVMFSERLAALFSGFYLYLKLYILGILILIFMATLPGAAFRIAEILWIGEIILIPMLIECFKPKWIMTILILILCTYWMWLNYITSNFIRPYYFNISL